MDMKRFFLYAIAIAALALAGCGGGGGSTMMDTTMPDTTPPDTTPPDTTPPDTTPPDTTTPGPTAMQAAMAIYLPDRDDVAGTIDDKRRPGRPSGEADSVSVAATVVVGGDVLGVADMAIEDDVEFDMSDAAPADIEDFAGSVHMRTDTGVTDTVTVYTDKEGPTDQAYFSFFLNTNTNRPAIVSGMEDGGTTGEYDADEDDEGQLAFTAGDITAKERKLFVATETGFFPTGDRQLFEFEDDMDTNSVDESMPSFDGTFHGIPGKYACTGTTCSAKTDKDGMLANLGGTWTFTPDKVEDIKVRDVVADPDYLSFGYWVQATEKDGETTYGVSTFYGGKQEFVGSQGTLDDSMAALEGSATYKGPATGMFVLKTFTLGDDNRPVATPSSSGQFTADAALTANFGGDQFGHESNYEIDGTVSNFRDGSGGMIDENWEVELMDAEFALVGQDNPSSGFSTTFDAKTSTGKGSTAGQWNGGFFGDPAADPTDDVDMTDDYPNSVAGEFNGHFDNGHVIGAFGATQ